MKKIQIIRILGTYDELRFSSNGKLLGNLLYEEAGTLEVDKLSALGELRQRMQNCRDIVRLLDDGLSQGEPAGTF